MAQRGNAQTPAQLEAAGLVQRPAHKFWSLTKLRANDVIYSYQNIVTPINYQPAHEALTTTLTVTSAIIKKQILAGTADAANVNLTLDSTDNLINGLFGGTGGVSPNPAHEQFDFWVINTDGGGQTFTVVAGDGDTTVSGAAVVADGVAACFSVSLQSGGSQLFVYRAS